MQQRLTTAIAILLLVSTGLACAFLRPRAPLSWHILLEIDAAPPERESAQNRTVQVLERRLDAFGLSNSQVVAQGTPSIGRILVSLPDVPDRKRVIDLITRGGLLELSAVISPSSPSPAMIYSTREEALASLGATVPDNRRVLPYVEREDTTVDERPEASRHATKWVVIESPAIVSGAELRDAAAVPAPGSDDSYNISFTLTPEGGKRFGDWTESHINNYLGVVLNGEVRSIAFIKSRITDQGEITGRFTKYSAEDLALILRSGALPAPLKIIETGNNK